MSFKLLLISFLIFNTGISIGGAFNIQIIRKQFYEAVEKPEVTNILYQQLTKLNPSPKTIEYAYWGASETLMAKHAYNPLSKIKYLNNGSKKINKCIALNPNSIEARFIRFNLERELPSFLGYNVHINEDKTCMITLLKKEEMNDLSLFFANTLLTSNSLNKDEVIQLEQLIKHHSKLKTSN